MLHVDVVVAMIPDRLHADVLGSGRRGAVLVASAGSGRLLVAGGPLVCGLVSRGSGVDEERRLDVAFAGAHQHPRVDALAVQSVRRTTLLGLRRRKDTAPLHRDALEGQWASLDWIGVEFNAPLDTV